MSSVAGRVPAIPVEPEARGREAIGGFSAGCGAKFKGKTIFQTEIQMIYPLFQAAAEYSKNYMGAWATMGAGIGAGLGVGRIGGQAVEGMARQPEMAGRITTSAIVFAALVEGAALFAIVISFLIQNKF